MNNEKAFQKLNKILEKIYCQEGLPLVLPQSNEQKGEGWSDAEESALDILSGEDDPEGIDFALKEFSYYHLAFALRETMCKKDSFQGNGQLCKNEFALSSAYAFLRIMLHSQVQQKINQKNRLYMHEVGFALSQQILSGWWEQAQNLSTHMINALSLVLAQKSSPLDGVWETLDYNMSWFVLELSCLAFDQTLPKDPSLYPSSDTAKRYHSIIAQWDSLELSDIDTMVSELCDLHLEDAILAESKGNKFYECIEGEYLLPHAALCWLKIRDFKGLKNPDSFSHPLMNHPMALRFDTKLKEPANLPYVQELFDILSADVPSVEKPSFFIS